MTIPILGEIEKLINEHGSAVILKERLALAADQYAALEGKLEACESTNGNLKNEVKRLESDLKKATEEINRLNALVKTFSKDENKPKLNTITEEILRKFFDAGRDLTVNSFGGGSTIECHFDILLNGDFITQSTYSNPIEYSLTAKGRAYVIENMNS